MNLTITLLKFANGEYVIEVNRPTGDRFKRTFTVQGLDEYLEAAEKYCEHKGYDLTFIDQA
jgi:glutathione synthase/RimK-type ligase-like ATP-grasp enzyme